MHTNAKMTKTKRFYISNYWNVNAMEELYYICVRIFYSSTKPKYGKLKSIILNPFQEQRRFFFYGQNNVCRSSKLITDYYTFTYCLPNA